MKLFSAFVLAILLFTKTAPADDGPPNWKVIAFGETEPADDGTGEDVDSFAGKSTHLGRFTGAGRHLIDHNTGAFKGWATYTASNGDQLDVIYTGQVVGIDPDAEFPILVVGDFEVSGGTGRLANATGCAKMTGGFTGVPGEFVFELEGTLHPQGK